MTDKELSAAFEVMHQRIDLVNKRLDLHKQYIDEVVNTIKTTLADIANLIAPGSIKDEKDS